MGDNSYFVSLFFFRFEENHRVFRYRHSRRIKWSCGNTKFA